MKRTREELVKQALNQLKREKSLGYGEYAVYYTLPAVNGGTITGVIDGFMADSAGDAVAFASRVIEFPEIDPEEADKMDDRSEAAKLKGYGITKVRKVLNEKEYTGEDMLALIEFIFNNYYREVTMKGSKITEEDNRDEILTKVVYLFKLPSNNRISDKRRQWITNVSNY